MSAKLPWMTRAQAAEWLGVSVSSIDRRLTQFHQGPRAGKLRYVSVKWDTKHTPIRILTEDVLSILPDPTVDEVPTAMDNTELLVPVPAVRAEKSASYS